MTTSNICVPFNLCGSQLKAIEPLNCHLCGTSSDKWRSALIYSYIYVRRSAFLISQNFIVLWSEYTVWPLHIDPYYQGLPPFNSGYFTIDTHCPTNNWKEEKKKKNVEREFVPKETAYEWFWCQCTKPRRNNSHRNRLREAFATWFMRGRNTMTTYTMQCSLLLLLWFKCSRTATRRNIKRINASLVRQKISGDATTSSKNVARTKLFHFTIMFICITLARLRAQLNSVHFSLLLRSFVTS